MAEFTHARCTRCGSTLISNGTRVWCSFVGGPGPRGQQPCTFGIDRAVLLADMSAAPSSAEPQAEQIDTEVFSPEELGRTAVLPPGAIDPIDEYRRNG